MKISRFFIGVASAAAHFATMKAEWNETRCGLLRSRWYVNPARCYQVHVV